MLITEVEGIPVISYRCQGSQNGLLSPQSPSPNCKGSIASLVLLVFASGVQIPMVIRGV